MSKRVGKEKETLLMEQLLLLALYMVILLLIGVPITKVLFPLLLIGLVVSIPFVCDYIKYLKKYVTKKDWCGCERVLPSRKDYGSFISCIITEWVCDACTKDVHPRVAKNKKFNEISNLKVQTI